MKKSSRSQVHILLEKHVHIFLNSDQQGRASLKESNPLKHSQSRQRGGQGETQP